MEAEDWKLLLDPDIRSFAERCMHMSVSDFILKYGADKSLPTRIIAAQIEGKQKAREKLPSFYESSQVIYPPKLNLEQSSSEATAKYKAGLLTGNTLIDLTGGFGIDSFFFSKVYDNVLYVEKNVSLFNTAMHNFDVLGASNIRGRCGDGVAMMAENQSLYDVIYIDPARRNTSNQKVFHLIDCEPDVPTLLPLLINRCTNILIKTSPMLDVDLAIKQLKYVSEVHIVSVNNDCKEVLYILDIQNSSPTKIITANITSAGDQVFTFVKEEEADAVPAYGNNGNYLYEPNASVMKSGAYKLISSAFNLKKMAPNTHIYSSSQLHYDFPGKIFEIIGVHKYKDEAIKGMKCNVVARNFPYSPEEIKKAMKLKDGGSVFLFAIKDQFDGLKLIKAQKIN